MTDFVPLETAARVLPLPSSAQKFRVETWSEIVYDGREEWAVKRLLPRVGIAAVFGKPGAFKSFIVSHISLCVALGWDWAGRRVNQSSVVYVGAEAAAGLRKRKAGFVACNADLPDDIPFALIPAAPNLGSDKGDLQTLISSVESAGLKPGVIVLDTLAATLGAGDENGAGMTAFVGNAGALAQHFGALVLCVHHTGLADDRRMRGHSSLLGALDAAILCERVEGDLAATLTVAKVKDDTSDVRLLVRLSRIVIGQDEDGEDISTLVVEGVEEVEAVSAPAKPRPVPASQRLLMACVQDAIEEAGETFRPFGGDGPQVRGVRDSDLRRKYFDRLADTAQVDEDPRRLSERQRKSFNRAIESALKSQALIACTRKGERWSWLP